MTGAEFLEFANGTPPLAVPHVVRELRDFANVPRLAGVAFHLGQIDARPLMAFVAALLRRSGGTEETVVELTGQGGGAPFDRLVAQARALSDEAAAFGDFAASHIFDTAIGALGTLDSERATVDEVPPDRVKHVYGVCVQENAAVRVVLGPKQSMASLYEHVRDRDAADRVYYFHVKRGPAGMADDVRMASATRANVIFGAMFPMFPPPADVPDVVDIGRRSDRRARAAYAVDADTVRDAERFRALAATQQTAPWASILGANGTLELFADAIVEVRRAAGDNAPAAVAATGKLMQGASDNTALAVRRYGALRAVLDVPGGQINIRYNSTGMGADFRGWAVDQTPGSNAGALMLDATCDQIAAELLDTGDDTADVRAVIDGGE